MTNMMRFYLAIFGLQILLISSATVSSAQVDPTKALIGTWEGQIEISRGNNARALIINSVKAKGEGEWVARGRYNYPDQINQESGGGQAMTVSTKNNEIFVDFRSGNANNPVHLKLVGDNKLEGTVDLGGKTGDRRIKFEKVAPKAGDVK
jgi:hypothetical protein